LPYGSQCGRDWPRVTRSCRPDCIQAAADGIPMRVLAQDTRRVVVSRR
jgi:hypothetical protein